MHRGEATPSRRSGARLDRLGILAAGLAQVRVQIDKTWQGNQAVGI